jgi:hypothetical protein
MPATDFASAGGSVDQNVIGVAKSNFWREPLDYFLECFDGRRKMLVVSVQPEHIGSFNFVQTLLQRGRRPLMPPTE